MNGKIVFELSHCEEVVATDDIVSRKLPVSDWPDILELAFQEIF